MYPRDHIFFVDKEAPPDAPQHSKLSQIKPKGKVLNILSNSDTNMFYLHACEIVLRIKI